MCILITNSAYVDRVVRHQTYELFIVGFVFFLTLLLFPCTALATDQPLRVGIITHIPPYVFPDQDRGIEVDIIRAVYDDLGVPVEICYLPRKRLFLAFEHGGLDAICTTRVDTLPLSKNIPEYPSDTTTVFQDLAITLNDGPSVTSIDQLSRLSVISFVNARLFLGDEFNKAVSWNKQYMEVSDQSLQISLLFKRRFQVAIADRNIFLYWLEQFLKTAPPEQQILAKGITFHEIFPVYERCLYFISSQERDRFNSGLKSIRDSGVHADIMASYVMLSDEP